jgi:hypothetical protein
VVSAGWGGGASRSSSTANGTDAPTVGSARPTGATRAASASSTLDAKEKPSALSYSCSAFDTEASVSLIVGALDIHSSVASYPFSEYWGPSRSITPTLGKLMYRQVASSITSSVVRVIWSEEVSATSVVGGGPEASATGEGPGTFTAGSELVAIATCIAPGAEGITTSRLSDDKGAAKPSSITATTSSPPGPAVSDAPMTARGVDASAIVPTSSTPVTGTGGGGVINASAAVAAAGTSSSCGGTISVPWGWE